MDTSDSFRDAASYLSSASSLTKVSNAIKLEVFDIYLPEIVCIRLTNFMDSYTDYSNI